MHSVFTTPKNLKITPSDENKNREEHKKEIRE